MIVILENPDGSQMITTDDGRTIILSAPNVNGEMKITSPQGKDLGLLSGEDANKHRTARFYDGNIYDIFVEKRFLGGAQEIWKKINTKP